jgi:hypothetical protein
MSSLSNVELAVIGSPFSGSPDMSATIEELSLNYLDEVEALNLVGNDCERKRLESLGVVLEVGTIAIKCQGTVVRRWPVGLLKSVEELFRS